VKSKIYKLVSLNYLKKQETIMKERTRAQESTGAIERLYISMRHLFSRGFYKPMGISGETVRK